MQNIFDVQGRVALITGAAGGLGTHFSHVLARAGARVALGGRRRQPLEALAGSIAADGGDALAVSVDVTDADTISAAFDRAEAHFGVVDVVVCKAGVATGELSVNLAGHDWQRVVETNLTGCWRVANEAAKRLITAAAPGT